MKFGETPTFMTVVRVCVSTLCIGRHRFTGKERDTETGLDNFTKRYHVVSRNLICLNIQVPQHSRQRTDGRSV
jgi:hypothetical protein